MASEPAIAAAARPPAAVGAALFEVEEADEVTLGVATAEGVTEADDEAGVELA